MTVRKSLTKSVEKKITKDWQQEIPSLGIFQTRHLLRRVGPLLIGICLDRDSSGEIYKPIFHVHCLCKEFPCVSLTLHTQLRSERSGGPDYIEVFWHEQNYKEAAERMLHQALLPLAGDIHIEQVISAYRYYMCLPLGKRQAIHLYRDMILLSAWAGTQAEALSLLEQGLKDIVDDMAFNPFGGRQSFAAKCFKLIENPNLLHQVVDLQIETLNVGFLPVAALLH